MLQHYVLIRYEKNVSKEHIEEFCRRMLALRTSIAGIEYLEIGRDILHDARSDTDHALRFSWCVAQLSATPRTSKSDGL